MPEKVDMADNGEIGEKVRRGGGGDMEASQISLSKEERDNSSYKKVLEMLATDATFQKDVTLGKRVGFYKFGREIGSGNFSKVKIGIHVLTKEKVAVKIMEKQKMDQKTQKLIQREIDNMEVMHHPNIVRLFEVMETMSKLYFVLEYAGGGELYGYVLDQGKLTESEAKIIYAQVLSAVIHMHERAIIHRDIKAENVFFAGPRWIKLGDFGFSVEIEPDQFLTTFCGSPPYAAPELFKDNQYQGEYVDIWALGILIYFMVTGNTPFRGETVGELKRQILDGFFTIPDHVSPFCQDLINGILRMAPLTRYTFGEILTHYWLGHTKFPEECTEVSLNPNEEEIKTNTMVVKVREVVKAFGITEEMLKEAADKRAKNSIVGTYRIVLYQHQKEEILAARDKLFADSESVDGEGEGADTKAGNKKSKLCTIL